MLFDRMKSFWKLQLASFLPFAFDSILFYIQQGWIFAPQTNKNKYISAKTVFFLYSFFFSLYLIP